MMLRITNNKEKRRAIWVPVVVATCALHLSFFYFGLRLAESTPRTVYEPSRVEFRALAPMPGPAPEPAPEEVKVETPKEPEPEPEKAAVVRAPRPNRTKAEPEPARPDEQPQKAVFGVTADSVAGQGGGVAVRVGNTLEKEMEKEFTRPSEVKELPPAPPAPMAAPKVEEDEKPIAPVPVYQLTTAPTFKDKVEPKYPEEAKRDGIEGTVQLEILIDENGRVRKIKVLKSPGHGFDKAAIAAVSKSKFNPGIINGKPVPVKIKIPYKFFLDA